MPDRTISRTFFNRAGAWRFCLLVAAVALTGLMARAWAWLGPSNQAAAPAVWVDGAGAAAHPPSRLAQEPAVAERVMILPTGFDPTEMTRRQGRFLLAVDNRSGLDDLELRLDREDGGRVGEARMGGDRLIWREKFNLPAGRYVLTEAGHPDWVCRITITAQ